MLNVQEQAVEVKECADVVSQLRRIGKGYPVFEYDQILLEKYGAKEEEEEETTSRCWLSSTHYLSAMPLLHACNTNTATVQYYNSVQCNFTS
jgi:hypothetical protein